MQKLILFAYLLLATSQISCQDNQNQLHVEEKEKQATISHAEVPEKNGLKRAYFASGCFWCVEAIYEEVHGVKDVISGYSGGHTNNPTYESSNTGKTGHAEAVEVIYNPKEVRFPTLVDVYFASQKITQVNGQGPDNGSQYRSILFYQNEEQKKIIEEKMEALNKKLGDKEVAAEVYPFEKFWKAENYHQDFKKKNPDHPYIQSVSIPRQKKFEEKMPEILKRNNRANH